MMVLCPSFCVLSVLLLVALSSVLVSGCDHCTSFGSPAFSPSTLVVQYGAPASVTCTVCDGTCDKGLEKSLGTLSENDTSIHWTVENMTEWNPSPLCYYTDVQGNQCCSRLGVTVYQLPDDVSIRFLNHSGAMLEGHQYSLKCTVPNVAPVQNLTVTFYKEHQELDRILTTVTQKTPMTVDFMQHINATKEDDGLQYWCEAKLQLGPDGPQRPPVASSKIINAVVHYKPQLQEPSHLHHISVIEGNLLLLNCSAIGNPSPAYTWTHPSGGSYPLSHNDSVFTVTSAALEHTGTHVCSVHNQLGSISVSFVVDVQRDFAFLYIFLVVIILAVILILLFTSCLIHRKKYRSGFYSLLGFRKTHSAVPCNTNTVNTL